MVALTSHDWDITEQGSEPRLAAGDIVDAVQKALLAPDTVDAVFKDLDAKINRKLKDQ